MTYRYRTGQRGARLTSGQVGHQQHLRLVEAIDREGWTTDDWATPWPVVWRLEEEFGKFDLDPCATPASAKAPRYFTAEDDGLLQPWEGRVFLNPPYSEIAPWVAKAVESARAGALVVAILPVRTERDWWHDLIIPFGEVRFQRGRQHYIGRDGTTTGRPVFASAIVIFRPPREEYEQMRIAE